MTALPVLVCVTDTTALKLTLFNLRLNVDSTYLIHGFTHVNNIYVWYVHRQPKLLIMHTGNKQSRYLSKFCSLKASNGKFAKGFFYQTFTLYSNFKFQPATVGGNTMSKYHMAYNF